MTKVSLSASVRGTSKPKDIQQALCIVELDIAELRKQLDRDPQTPWVREIGYRLIAIGQYLATQGRPR